MDDDEIPGTEDLKDEKPLEVTIKKEKETSPPSFDYDDYTPSEQEIVDTEIQIKENIEKRTKHGT